MPKLPIVGNIEKGPLTITILAGAAVGGYMWYRHNKNKQAQQQAAQSGAGQYGYGTQYGYGQYYSYGSNPAANTYGYGYGAYGLGSYGYGAGGNYYGYGYYGAGTPTPVPQQAQTNAQWSQAAVSALTAQGYSGQEVLGALGIYLTGGNLNATQVGIVQAAIAAEGYPPTSGAGGFPPQWHTAGSPGGGQGNGDGGGDGTKKPGKPNLLTASQVGPGLINANWNVVPGATSYEFQVTPPDSAPHDIGDRTGYNAADLNPGYHTVRVAAKNSAGMSAFATKRVNVKQQGTRPPKGGSVPTPFIPGGPEIPA